MDALGSLMDASHASCAQLYECSCLGLDRLTGAAQEAGALVSWLTGGCKLEREHQGSVVHASAWQCVIRAQHKFGCAGL